MDTNTPDERERLWTVEEIADRLRVTRDTVRRWLRTGVLHGVMPGGTRAGYRVRESEVRRIEEARHAL